MNRPPDIADVCLYNEDGDWFCPKSGPIDRDEMARRQIASYTGSELEDVQGQIKDGFMRALPDEEAQEFFSHVICKEGDDGAEPYWVFDV